MTDLTLSLLHGGQPDFTSPPIEIHVEEEHAEPVGLVLREDGEEILRVLEADVDGTVFVTTGGVTGTIDVAFVDDLGEEFVPDEPEFSMIVEIADPSRATFEQLGDWSFRMQGLAAGSTTFTIAIFHIDHPDYTSPDLPLRVLRQADAPGTTIAGSVDLLPVTPNPIAQSATIRYRLPAASRVEFTVHDVAGRRISAWTEGSMPAGEGAATWYPGSLAPGAYWIRLTTPDGIVRSRQVIVSR
jgi:hypothetical protein